METRGSDTAAVQTSLIGSGGGEAGQPEVSATRPIHPDVHVVIVAVFGAVAVLAWLIVFEEVNKLLWENEVVTANPWLFPVICLPLSLVAGLLVKYRNAPTPLPLAGQIHELRNAIERSLLSCKGDTIDAHDLPYTIVRSTGGVAPADSLLEQMGAGDLDAWLESVERRAILQAHEGSGGVQAQAARRLGISERSLWHRIKKLKIQVNKSFA